MNDLLFQNFIFWLHGAFSSILMFFGHTVVISYTYFFNKVVSSQRLSFYPQMTSARSIQFIRYPSKSKQDTKGIKSQLPCSDSKRWPIHLQLCPFSIFHLFLAVFLYCMSYPTFYIFEVSNRFIITIKKRINLDATSGNDSFSCNILKLGWTFRKFNIWWIELC